MGQAKRDLFEMQSMSYGLEGKAKIMVKWFDTNYHQSFLEDLDGYTDQGHVDIGDELQTKFPEEYDSNDYHEAIDRIIAYGGEYWNRNN